ncbi:MAG TPA: hydantoinase/oxoprolinase family protein [Pyrinomonadaceae bacterium]|nr:hydantoinase/oxoprolinase family protein [Pyrinomonadaceae bacterium]
MPTKSRSKRSKKSVSLIRVGVDTGGTFTDFVFELDGQLQIFKLASTPADPAQAILAGLKQIEEKVSADAALEVVHGTTVGTNALLQRRGARAALVTTKGFEDVLEIGRQARPELYNLNAIKPSPLVPDNLRFGVDERVVASGEILEQLSDADIEKLVSKLKRLKPESIAISLLFSFANSKHEQRLAQALAALGVPLSVSHQILPEYREYERTSTVTVNAYLQPLMGDYLNRLINSFFSETAQQPKPQQKPNQRVFFRVMQSSGGSISAVAAAHEPVRTILSGPAGGIVGALRSAGAAGFADIITFDMGGTSTDVALCDRGALRMTNEATVSGLPVAVPVMDIHTVGAGGGSIARVDEGGSLRVGPESAGADPGPACYGNSLLPTVTDAHLVLGHFGGYGLLGGKFKLDEERARIAMTALAKEMSQAANRKVNVEQAAQGVVSVVNTNMERALRRISVERGYDPRDFTLLPFGGAGGLHAVDLARALKIPAIISPSAGGALSAIGVLAADVVKDQSRTVMLEVKPGIEATLDVIFRELEESNRVALQREGFSDSKQRHARTLAARYKGQSFEMDISQTKRNIAEAFHRAHLARYGYAQRSDVVEIVAVRLRSSGLVEPLKQRRLPKSKAAEAKPRTQVTTVLDGKKQRLGVYEREDLSAHSRLMAPCIVVEYSSTTLIPTGTEATVDTYANLIINLLSTQHDNEIHV